MKGKGVLAVGLSILLLVFLACAAPAAAADASGSGELPALKSLEDKTSYALGVETGRNLKRQEVVVDPDIMARGIKDAYTGGKLQLTDEDLLLVLNRFAAELKSRRETARAFQGQDNKKDGEAFLAENKTKEGVVTLPSGLQYKIIKAGNGKKPTLDDTVEILYRSSFIDGVQYDGTTDTGPPATLKVSDSLKVIPGLREALKLMPEGSKWELFIPETLAYGQRGSNLVGPYSTLIFEVELVAVK